MKLKHTKLSYHTSLQDVSLDVHAALTQPLPLFYDKAAAPAMIKHGINALKSATEFVNPG